MHTFFRLSTSLTSLAFLLPVLNCPHQAFAQDIACAVGAPAGETDDAGNTESNGSDDARTALHRLATGMGVKVAVIDTVGGAISGNCATGRLRMAMTPASIRTIAITHAKMGRSMK